MRVATRTRIVRSRAAGWVAAAVLPVLGVSAWAGVTAVGAIDGSAGGPPIEMVRAVPADHHPATIRDDHRAPRIGNWTPRRGELIARRALRWRGWPYSFDAGGASGPSYGHAVDRDSRHDDRVYGFDCSGLTMYALAPWLSLTHYAAAQYTEVGSYHPAIDALEPGDLVFWSKDGTVEGIGHVAIYIASGLVIQAPHSGDVIRVTPIYRVDTGTMGATRPLT